MKTGVILPNTMKFIWCFLLVTFSLPRAQQEDEWQNVKPNIIDRKLLITQYYDKKLFSVLPDTIRSASYSRHKTWVALGKVVIAPGEKLTIPSDTKLYFEPNASIEVEGTLEAAGTEESEIQMSIIDREDMYIAPKTGEMLWKGITVGQNGRLLLKNVKITGARSGVVANGVCDSLLIDNVIFSGVGSAEVSYLGKTIPVNLDIPFSLSCEGLKSKIKMNGNGYRIASNWFFGEAAALVAAGIITTVTGYNTDRKVTVSHDHAEAQGYSNKATTLYSVSSGCYIGAGACAVSAVIFRLIFKAAKGS